MTTAQTLRLHPKNPRIFEYQGKPTLIVGSGEHYGAVMNLGFDFKTYLNTLKKEGINQTRLFVGAHREVQGAFGIERNTMAMPDAQYICAWAKTGQNTEGGLKYDLSRFDEAYFERLRQFVQLAQDNGVIVEICLFSSIYENGIWALSPLNPKNNVNNLPNLPFRKTYTTENGSFQPFLTNYTQKVVTFLNGFDNIYFEIQNEPWSDNGVYVGSWNDFIQGDMLKQDGNMWRTKIEVASLISLDWQANMAQLIRETEAKLPKKHLISQNYCNYKHPLSKIDPRVDILNFHYNLPESVGQNWHWRKPIGFNETGFSGKADATYRRQAFRFLMSGGSLFSNLDYSFTVGNETGNDLTNNAPGGGSPAFRESLRILRGVLEDEYTKNLQPTPSAVVAKGANVWTLSDKKTVWLVYGEHYEDFVLNLDLPNGRYSFVQKDAATGKELHRSVGMSTKGKAAFASNLAAGDWILEVRKQ